MGRSCSALKACTAVGSGRQGRSQQANRADPAQPPQETPVHCGQVTDWALAVLKEMGPAGSVPASRTTETDQEPSLRATDSVRNHFILSCGHADVRRHGRARVAMTETATVSPEQARAPAASGGGQLLGQHCVLTCLPRTLPCKTLTLLATRSVRASHSRKH